MRLCAGNFLFVAYIYGNYPEIAFHGEIWPDPALNYNPAATADQQFRNPVHSVHISRDGLV